MGLGDLGGGVRARRGETEGNGMQVRDIYMIQAGTRDSGRIPDCREFADWSHGAACVALNPQPVAFGGRLMGWITRIIADCCARAQRGGTLNAEMFATYFVSVK